MTIFGLGAEHSINDQGFSRRRPPRLRLALFFAGMAQEPASKTVEFTILQLNDVYEVDRPESQALGGLSRVALHAKTARRG